MIPFILDYTGLFIYTVVKKYNIVMADFYYFDMETTGLNPEKNKIITIQHQKLDEKMGEPIEELHISKEWELSEKELLRTFLPQIQCSNPWDFIIIGKDLLFDFNFLDKRSKIHGFNGFDISYCYERIFLDLKYTLVLINNGRFKGYGRVLDPSGFLSNVDVPRLYQEGKFQEITAYIKRRAEVFLKAFQTLKSELPTFRESFRW